MEARSINNLFALGDEAVNNLAASLSEEAALACKPYTEARSDVRRQSPMGWQNCRRLSGVSHSAFLVAFYAKFGFFPEMQHEASGPNAKSKPIPEEERLLWRDLYRFESALARHFHERIVGHEPYSIRTVTPRILSSSGKPDQTLELFLSRLANGNDSLQTPEILDIVSDVLGTKFGWSTLPQTRNYSDAEQLRMAYPIVVKFLMLERANVPSYYLSPFVTASALRSGSKTDSAAVTRVKTAYPNAARQWEPKHYNLVFRADPKAIFLSFVGRVLPREVMRDDYVFGDDQHHIPELRALWGYYTPSAAKKLKQDLRVVSGKSRKHPGLKIVLGGGSNAVLGIRGTHLPTELFPFPSYMEPDPKLREKPNTWKRVAFDSAKRTVTVTYKNPPVTRTYGNNPGESINPMQWMGQAWKTFETLALEKGQDLDNLDIISVQSDNILPVYKNSPTVMPIIFHESKPERSTLKTTLYVAEFTAEGVQEQIIANFVNRNANAPIT